MSNALNLNLPPNCKYIYIVCMCVCVFYAHTHTQSLESYTNFLSIVHSHMWSDRRCHDQLYMNNMHLCDGYKQAQTYGRWKTILTYVSKYYIQQ